MSGENNLENNLKKIEDLKSEIGLIEDSLLNTWSKKREDPQVNKAYTEDKKRREILLGKLNYLQHQRIIEQNQEMNKKYDEIIKYLKELKK